MTATEEAVATYRLAARRHRKEALMRRVAGDQEGRDREVTAVDRIERAVRAELHPEIDR